MPAGSVFTATALAAISGKFKKISVALRVLAVLFVLRYIFLKYIYAESRVYLGKKS